MKPTPTEYTVVRGSSRLSSAEQHVTVIGPRLVRAHKSEEGCVSSWDGVAVGCWRGTRGEGRITLGDRLMGLTTAGAPLALGSA